MLGNAWGGLGEIQLETQPPFLPPPPINRPCQHRPSQGVGAGNPGSHQENSIFLQQETPSTKTWSPVGREKNRLDGPAGLTQRAGWTLQLIWSWEGVEYRSTWAQGPGPHPIPPPDYCERLSPTELLGSLAITGQLPQLHQGIKIALSCDRHPCRGRDVSGDRQSLSPPRMSASGWGHWLARGVETRKAGVT